VTYVYLTRPVRPGWDDGLTTEEEATMSAHFSYLQQVHRKGDLLLAGPCEDAAFSIVVFQATSDEQAAAMMATDPAVRAGIVTAELHRFRISLQGW
jgi:uncharacterized protein YciI